MYYRENPLSESSDSIPKKLSLRDKKSLTEIETTSLTEQKIKEYQRDIEMLKSDINDLTNQNTNLTTQVKSNDLEHEISQQQQSYLQLQKDMDDLHKLYCELEKKSVNFKNMEKPKPVEAKPNPLVNEHLEDIRRMTTEIEQLSQNSFIQLKEEREKNSNHLQIEQQKNIILTTKSNELSSLCDKLKARIRYYKIVKQKYKEIQIDIAKITEENNQLKKQQQLSIFSEEKTPEDAEAISKLFHIRSENARLQSEIDRYKEQEEEFKKAQMEHQTLVTELKKNKQWIGLETNTEEFTTTENFLSELQKTKNDISKIYKAINTLELTTKMMNEYNLFWIDDKKRLNSSQGVREYKRSKLDHQVPS